MTEIATAPLESAEQIEETTSLVRQVAHELRQPLSTIESIAYYLDLILPRNEARVRAQLERLQKMVDQSNWIVSNAVHYVQASPPAPQSLDLGELLTTAAVACSTNSLELDLGDPAPLVHMDPGQASHLFYNMLIFLRHLGTVGHPLVVSAAEYGPFVEVRFSISAPGYSREEVQGMFEPFSAGLPTGSGLSMACVRRIVEAHDGTVSADADLDRGITITLTLPG